MARSLGRSLAGGAANVPVNLVQPGTLYGDRTTRLDLRLSKLLRLRGSRTMFNVDLFNALNGAGVLEHNTNFAAWQRPIAIMMARTIRLGVQFDF